VFVNDALVTVLPPMEISIPVSVPNVVLNCLNNTWYGLPAAVTLVRPVFPDVVL
jgi:hypothetical protein